MSDLANFIAATIESKVVADLKEENDRLREEIEDTKDAAQLALRLARHEGGVIRITGPVGDDGRPIIYARGCLWQAQYSNDVPNPGAESAVWGALDFPVKRFHLPLLKAADIPAKDLMKIDIRLSGPKVASMRPNTNESDDSSPWLKALTDGSFYERHVLFQNEPNSVLGGWKLYLDFRVYPTGNHEEGIDHEELGDSWKMWLDSNGNWDVLEDEDVRDVTLQCYFECIVHEGDFFHTSMTRIPNNYVHAGQFRVRDEQS